MGSGPSSGRPRPPGSVGVAGAGSRQRRAPGSDGAPGRDGASGSGRLPPGSRPAGRGRRRRRARDLERLERAGVGRLLGALRALLGLRLVREARALDGGRRVGVVEGRELLPQRAALLGAEAALERVEQLGLGELAPAALAEDPADQRGGREEVGHLPVVGTLRAPDRDVLARHLGRVQARLGDVLVDAGDVAERVVLQLAAAVAVEVVAEVELALVVGLRVGRERPLLGVHGAVGRRAADEGGQLRAAQVAQHVDEEQAVLRGRVAGAEHRPGARGPVDVGDPEALVAHDGDVGARRDGGLDVLGLHAEGRVLVVAPEVLGLEARGRVHQVAVHRELVVAVRRALARGQEGRELDPVGQAVGARRQHVVEAAGVVRGVGLDVGLRRRHQRDEDDRPEGGDETPHVTSCRTARQPSGAAPSRCATYRRDELRRSVRAAG